MTASTSRLVSLRKAAGFSNAAEAAKRLGVSRIHLAQIESGRASPSPDLAQRMAVLYGLPVANLEALLRDERQQWLQRQLKAS